MQRLESWIAAHPRMGLVIILLLALILAWALVRSRLKRSVRPLRDRVKTAREAAMQAWRDSSPPARRHCRKISPFKKAWRWLGNHLVQLIAWPLMLATAWVLVTRITKATNGGASSREDLVLLGLILAFAIVAQSGNALLSRLRLKKLGPLEFVEERFDRILPELKEWARYVEIGYVDLETAPRPSAILLWEYTKAETFITHLEWSGIEASGLKDKEKLHDLLFKMSSVAMLDRRWAPAINWLDLLLEITGGEFKAAETHYRYGIACWKLAGTLGQTKVEQAEKEGLRRKAKDHFVCATKARSFHQAYFNLAYVEFLLLEYNLARENNAEAIRILPSYAEAKYNLALCFVKLGDMDQGLVALKSIAPSDKAAGSVARFALTDEDLFPLLGYPGLGFKAKRHLDTLAYPAGSMSA